jgi:hypothetical protein
MQLYLNWGVLWCSNYPINQLHHHHFSKVDYLFRSPWKNFPPVKDGLGELSCVNPTIHTAFLYWTRFRLLPNVPIRKIDVVSGLKVSRDKLDVAQAVRH